MFKVLANKKKRQGAQYFFINNPTTLDECFLQFIQLKGFRKTQNICGYSQILSLILLFAFLSWRSAQALPVGIEKNAFWQTYLMRNSNMNPDVNNNRK